MSSIASFSPVSYLPGRAGRPLKPSGVQASSHLPLRRQTLPIVKALLKVIFVGCVMKVASLKRLTSEAIQKLS